MRSRRWIGWRRMASAASSTWPTRGAADRRHRTDVARLFTDQARRRRDLPAVREPLRSTTHAARAHRRDPGQRLAVLEEGEGDLQRRLRRRARHRLPVPAHRRDASLPDGRLLPGLGGDTPAPPTSSRAAIRRLRHPERTRALPAHLQGNLRKAPARAAAGRVARAPRSRHPVLPGPRPQHRLPR